MKLNKILYVSTLCTPPTWEKIFASSTIKPGQAVQKFHRLIVEGLSINKSKCFIEMMSVVPVVPQNNKRLFWFLKSEKLNNIKCRYIPFINLAGLKEFTVFLFSFFRVIFWGINNGNKNVYVICDLLNFSISAGTLLACKLTRIKIVTIVTDIPGLIIRNQNRLSLKSKIFNFLVSLLMKKFSGYILLTEQMNQLVNPKGRPFLIMEGLVDKDTAYVNNTLENKDEKQILIYAGGIYEKYGVKNLIEGFMMLEEPDVRLHIYGAGSMVNEMSEYCIKDKRIVYHGVVPNTQVVKAQLRATLLINPRPSTLELSKFSFPSKNMEYLASGTPLLTSALPGMPLEYYDYVYLFYNESALGIYFKLRELLSIPKMELHQMGARAKNYVLSQKNNEIQAKRILSFLMNSY